MKSLQEQDHYELLEVPRDASLDQIERAYRVLSATYEQDSLAVYSLFDGADADALRDRIDLAYRVLSDVDARRAYDTDNKPAVELDDLRTEDPDLSALAGTPGTIASAEVPPTIEAFEDLESAADEDGEGTVDGASLRRSRLRRGIEIDEIADITKISPSYLRYIEEENFADLPASVYVRGFVTAYARAIGLDGQRVASSYMTRVAEVDGPQRRGFLLGRR